YLAVCKDTDDVYVERIEADPAFAQELAVIVHAGMHEMLALERDVFYYITLTNESLPQRAISDSEGVLRGMHRIASIGPAQPLASTADVRLLASGAMVHQALQAAQWLAEQGFSVDVFSVTSWSRLAREAMRAERLERIAAANILRFITLAHRGVNPHLAKQGSHPEGSCLIGHNRDDSRTDLRIFQQVAEHAHKGQGV
ncbi:MAG: hypothetical protein EBX55_05995, partial [Betaproteobacteria bacterium]|nr:hypothetical protein [Betaproteobacteria bacterium]